ncbi:MAG: glycosyltransferase family 4 protein [Betaproteobacteria bacterium]|nr:glycosyltransferase family 4 protein [Betaproteobacteria bacterium]
MDDVKRFSKVRTGLGYMVWTIAKALAVGNHDVNLQTVSGIGTKCTIDNVNIEECKPWKVLWRAIKHGGLFSMLAVKPTRLEPSAIKCIYSQAFADVFLRKCKKESCDVINLHGATEANRAIIARAGEQGRKIVLTLHGLRDGNISNEFAEIPVVRACLTNGGAVTVTSTGVMRKLEQQLAAPVWLGRISVVANGVFSERDSVPNQRRAKHQRTGSNPFRFVCVGNITRNKNQIQIAKAVNKMSPNLRRSVVIDIIGAEHDDGELRRYVKNYDLGKVVILHGYVARERLAKFYEAAHGVLVVSHMEGFGMSVCEGFRYGIPSLLYSDLDVVADIYDEAAVMLMKERCDGALAEAMLSFSYRSWDRVEAIRCSKPFSQERMAETYLNVFRNVVGNSDSSDHSGKLT